MLDFVAILLGLLVTRVPRASANIFQSVPPDDDRHYDYPSTRNSTNPLNLPLFSSRPSATPSIQPTRFSSRSKSFQFPTKLPSKPEYVYPKQKSSSPSPTSSYRAVPSVLPTSTRPSTSTIFFPSPTAKAPSNGPSCISTAGDFGQVTSSAVTVIYNYKMELSNSNSIHLIILPSLEIAVSDSLIASFITICNMSNFSHGNTSTSIASSSTTQQVVGISSSPPDLVQSNSCVTITSPATGCFLVQGRLTLYLPLIQRRQLSSIDAYNEASNSIKSGMASGALAKCNRDIVSLTYLSDDDSAIILLSNITNTSTNSSTNTNTFPLVIAWALIGVLSVALVGIYAKFRLNRHFQIDKSKRTAAVICDDGIEVIANNSVGIPLTHSSVTLGLLESEWVEFHQSEFVFDSPNSRHFSEISPLGASWSDSVKDDYDFGPLLITASG